MSVLPHCQCNGPGDRTIDSTILIAFYVSLTMASWLSAAFVTTTVIIAPVLPRFLMPWVFAVMSIFTLVVGPRASSFLAFCPMSEKITDGCDQILNGMAL